MDRAVKKYLEDIQTAIAEIELFLEQRPKQYQVYLDDHMFKSAIERQIGIIGEALNQALKIDSFLPINNAKKIVATRNYIVHAYDSLRPDIIWNIVINHIPI